MSKKEHNRIGFTLAEVLITLGIIGVVAAMTIPNLISTYRKKQIEVQAKVTYSTIQQALRFTAYDDLDYSTVADGSNQAMIDWFNTFLAPHLKVEQICVNKARGCWHQVRTLRNSNYGDENGIGGNILGFTISKGARFVIDGYNTGLDSAYMAYFISDLARMQGGVGSIAMSNSQCLSADVNAAFDPTFAGVLEKRNAAFANKGIVVTKYTGSRGKSGTSDASAEFMGKIRKLFNENGVVWQVGELGKVDEGGGGTVAKYVAYHNIDVVDVGVPVLSMHAPYEVISKIDLYMAYKGFLTFFTK